MSNQPFRRTWYRITHVRQQLSYSILMPVLSVLSTLAFAISGQISSDAMLRRLAVSGVIDPAALDDLMSQTHMSFHLIIALGVVVGVTQSLVSIIWSRRVFGPTVAIKNHVAALRSGNFSSRIQLRRFDELKDVAEDLNLLAADLEASKSSRAG